MAEKEPPKLETQMAITGFFRVLVFVVFPIGYIFFKWGELPWPVLSWGAIMLFLALHGVAKGYASQIRTECHPRISEEVEDDDLEQS